MRSCFIRRTDIFARDNLTLPLSSLRAMPAVSASPPCSLPAWHDFNPRALWHWPLPDLSARSDRWLLRGFVLAARKQVRAIHDWHHALPDQDPFVLIANHNSRRETVWLIALLLLLRGGRPVHFLGDWNFCLIPGIAELYRRTGTIRVARKPARPRCLNRLKPYFVGPIPALEQARAQLARGHSIGLFPEGTVNRDPARLLRGRFGAARLSLTAGVPVVPVGIRHAATRAGRIDSGSAVTLRFGAPLTPPRGGAPNRAAVHDWHEVLMLALALVSGKVWEDGLPTGAGAHHERVSRPCRP